MSVDYFPSSMGSVVPHRLQQSGAGDGAPAKANTETSSSAPESSSSPTKNVTSSAAARKAEKSSKKASDSPAIGTSTGASTAEAGEGSAASGSSTLKGEKEESSGTPVSQRAPRASTSLDSDAKSRTLMSKTGEKPASLETVSMDMGGSARAPSASAALSSGSHGLDGVDTMGGNVGLDSASEDEEEDTLSKQRQSFSNYHLPKSPREAVLETVYEDDKEEEPSSAASTSTSKPVSAALGSEGAGGRSSPPQDSSLRTGTLSQACGE